MTTTERTIWGIHAGKTGDADALFFKQNCIALGWERLGDLGTLKPDREAFKARMAAAYPHFKPGAIPTTAGQLFRFVHVARPGDLVVYPSKRDRHVHFGEIVGPYRHDPATETTYPNRIAVKWLKEAPRTHFSQGALYEIGSALSFFQVSAHADEFLAMLEGKPKPSLVSEDETIGAAAEDIEEATRVFILKRLSQEVKGHPFAHFVAHLFQVMGYKTQVAPEGPDGAIDILAHRDELGLEPPIIKIQAKSGDGKIGDA